MSPWRRLLLLALLGLWMPASSRAQSTTPAPAPQTPVSPTPAPPAPAQQLPDAPSTSASENDFANDSAAERRAEAEREVKTQEAQRILAVVPNFNTVITGQGVALSPREKTDLALHATFDPFNLVGAFFLAGVSEVSDTDRGYGWGPGGYAKRVGANIADVIDGTMLAGAVYPILLHQDPRFFRQGRGTIRSRIRHALTAPFICRGDDGSRQVNYSNLLGNFTAGAISNAYYPAGDRGVSLALVNSSVVTLEGSLGNIGLEFAPDVQAYWKRRREAKRAARMEQPGRAD